jgi:hypothetical protein
MTRSTGANLLRPYAREQNKKRKKPVVAEEDRTALYERAARVYADGRGEEDTGPTPLALPVKRLDGTVVHEPMNAEPIDGPGVDDNLHNLSGAARAAVEKARQDLNEVGEEGGAKKGKKARVAEELANELGKTEYRQLKTTDKWWDAKKPGEEEPEEEEEPEYDDEEEDDDDGDPASQARRARARDAEHLEAEMSAEERRGAVQERIASTCHAVLEDPEAKWTELRAINKLVEAGAYTR